MASAIRFAMMHPTVRPGTAAGVSTASTHTASEMRNCTGPQASPCSAKSVMRVAAAYTAAIMPAWATYVVFLFMDMLLFSARRGAAGFGQLVIRECRAQRCKRGAVDGCEREFRNRQRPKGSIAEARPRAHGKSTRGAACRKHRTRGRTALLAMHAMKRFLHKNPRRSITRRPESAPKGAAFRPSIMHDALTWRFTLSRRSLSQANGQRNHTSALFVRRSARSVHHAGFCTASPTRPDSSLRRSIAARRMRRTA